MAEEVAPQLLGPEDRAILGLEGPTVAGQIGERHALRVAVVSLGSRLCFGFCADPAIVDDVQAMAHGVEAESGALVGRVC